MITTGRFELTISVLQSGNIVTDSNETEAAPISVSLTTERRSSVHILTTMFFMSVLFYYKTF